MVRLAGEKNAKHFTGIAARKLFRSINPSQLSSLAMSDKDERLMVDDGKQSHFWTAYTISLHVPGKLVEEACPFNLPDVVGLWQSCTKLGTKAKLRIPVSSRKGFTTKRYQEWWTKHASDFVKGDIEPAKKQEKPKTPVRIRLTKGKGAVTPIEVNGTNATLGKAKSSKAKPSRTKPIVPHVTSAHEVGGANATISKARPSKAKPTIPPITGTHEVDDANATTGKAKASKARPSKAKPNQGKDLPKDASKEMENSTLKPKHLLKVSAPKIPSMIIKNPTTKNGDKKRRLVICDGDNNSSQVGSQQLESCSQSSGGSIDGPDSFGLLSGKGRSVEEASRQISHEKTHDDMPKGCGPNFHIRSEKTSLDHVDDIEDEAEKVLKEMRNMKVMDISPVQCNLKSFFDNIRAYKNHSTSIKSCVKFEALEVDKAKLKRALEGIDTKLKAKEAAVVANEGELFEVQLEISNLEDKVSAIKNAAIQTDEDIAKSEEMRRLLEANQNELANFKLFP
ncbi:hypothetical protein RHSIM_Rhsim02G0154400 [Rhododendron simsii]|uniref:Uncharacterized protein n=1 Tax=Rhododendron simsii TaxID=118357 RepID=A0A834HDM7_RHOSS|nr:hypothetical protein RHSIM_Rhsim02G0154400 [Rhododendron simsii]